MESLQFALTVAGCLLLACIAVCNAWTVRRNTPRQAEHAEPQADPDGSADAALDNAALLAAQPFGAEHLDPRIDSIIPIVLDMPVSGEKLIARLPAVHRIGSKPFTIEARHERTLRWEAPQPGRLYDACKAGLQLANRTGAVSQVEFSEFVIKTQAFADAIGGSADSPDMDKEMTRAHELDRIAARCDAQLTLILGARATPWSLGFVRQQAARQGFVDAAVIGRMVLPAQHAGAPHLVELAYDAQIALSDNKEELPIYEISLNIDVPQIAPQAGAFDQLLQSAAALGESMDGIIMDPAGQLLTEKMVMQLRDELVVVYKTLIKHQLPAGASATRRLFS